MKPHWKSELNHAVNKALRHDHNLPVNHLGFARATDLAFVLSQPPYRLSLPSMADMMFVITRERPGRFQAASRHGTMGPEDVIIRCLQWHCGNVLHQMENESAHDRIWDPSLLPWQRRDHVHCATALPVDGVLPAGFWKMGIDCIMYLDAAVILEYCIEMFMSDANVVLISRVVPVETIRYITLLSHPQLTVYKRPTPSQLDHCSNSTIKCRLCDGEWQLGTWPCLKCWEP